MPLDTSIARSIKPLQVQFRDLGADYNQLAQMQSAESQNQLAQMQMQERQQLAPLRLQEQQSRAATAKMELDDVNEAQTYIKSVMTKAAEASGGSAPTDPFAAAEQMFNHPNPMVRSSGEQLLKSLQVLQAYKNQRDYEASRQPSVGAAPTVPVNATAAPMVAPMNAVGPNKAMLGNRINPKLSEEDAVRVMALSKTGNIDYPGERWTVSEKGNLILEPMPDNLLADKVAPAASAEPVANAMARPVNPLQDAAALLKKIQEGDNQFSRGGTPAPGWKNDRDLLVRAFEQALKPGRGEGGRYLSLGAGKALDQDTGQIISADRVPAAAATAKILKIGNVPYTLDAEGTLVPTPIQGGLPIVAKGGAGKAATGGVGGEKMPTGSVNVIDPTDPTGKKVIVVTAARAIKEGLTPASGVPKEDKLKPIPAHINTAISTNNMSINQIQEALDLIKKNPNAIGLKNYLSDEAIDRADPKGVAARSALSNISSLVIHERSGSAVSASEMQRLGFIPAKTNTYDAAKTKLEAMLKYAKAQQQGLTETYAEDQGYKPNPTLAGKNDAPPPAAGAGEWKVVK
jgi:hypothetical protein